MATLTNRNDVVVTFDRYHGRNPGASDEATIQYLMTKAPQEVEKLLAKNSPITKGLLWADYQKAKGQQPVAQTNVQVPVKQSQPVQPTPQQPATPSPKTQSRPVQQTIGDSAVNHLYSLYLGRDANQQELDMYKNHADDTVLRKDLEFARKNAQEAQANQNKTTGGTGEAFFQDGANGAYIKFSTDPDGAGPQSANTVWWADPVSKNLYPIISEDAFLKATGMKIGDATAQGLIATRAITDLNDGGTLSGFFLLPNEYGVQNDGTYKTPPPTLNDASLAGRYGQTFDERSTRQMLTALDENILPWLEEAGVSAETIKKISSDPKITSLYVNAITYGGYSIPDLYRDAKARELGLSANVISAEMTADKYYATPEGSAAKNNATLTPPAQIGNIDIGLLDAPIFSLSDEIYEVLVKPFDWTTEAGQAELDTIKSAYHDVLVKQAEATTEREKTIADYNYNLFKEEVAKRYEIALSDNSTEAWAQIAGLGALGAQKGLSGSGLEGETIDKYLANVRKQDQRNRETRLTEEENKKREQLLKYGTPEQIAALSATEKEKYGFTPSAEAKSWFSTENLKKLYPNISDQEIANYQSMMFDSSGNYMSELYQKLALNKYEIGEQKKTFQLGEVQKDDNGDIIGGSGLLLKKSLEEEKAYKEYEQAGIGEGTPTPTNTVKATTPTLSKSSDTNTWSINPANKVATPVSTPVTPATVGMPTLSKSSDSTTWKVAQSQAKATTPSWTAPAGYEKISGPSQLVNYTNIVDEPGTINKWGKKK